MEWQKKKIDILLIFLSFLSPARKNFSFPFHFNFIVRRNLVFSSLRPNRLFRSLNWPLISPAVLVRIGACRGGTTVCLNVVKIFYVFSFFSSCEKNENLIISLLSFLRLFRKTLVGGPVLPSVCPIEESNGQNKNKPNQLTKCGRHKHT